MYDIIFILKNYYTPKALTNIKAHAKNMVFNFFPFEKNAHLFQKVAAPLVVEKIHFVECT
jgi:hypothetical protein